jgi:hypothetical protein
MAFERFYRVLGESGTRHKSVILREDAESALADEANDRSRPYLCLGSFDFVRSLRGLTPLRMTVTFFL